MTEAADPRTPGWSGLPRWARIGIIALAAVVVLLVALVAIRIATRVPAIPLGPTAAADLRAGSCVAESDATLDGYTVVPCDVAHPMQVFAAADLLLDQDVYDVTDESLRLFADAVCRRYLEYRLFLVADLRKLEYDAFAVAVPHPDDFSGGDTTTMCGIVPDSGDLTTDLYRPMP